MNYYKIVVNENDDTGVDFNSFVDVPAHLKGFIAFGKDSVRYEFNDEKRIVTGVMISAGTPIYRNSKDIGEHYVIFDAQTIDVIRKKFFKNGFNQNLNTNHDPNTKTNGATLIDSYIVSNSDPKLPNIPEAFSQLRLQDGSWIASYHVTDNILWDEVKSGKFQGFSVEGWFDKVQVNVKQNKTKMSKNKKTIWEMMGFSKEEETFAQATTADGVVLFYEGDLMEGTPVMIEVEGEQVPAPEGEHEVTLEDETVKIITLDGAGVVLSIMDFNAEPTNEPTAEEELKAEVVEVMNKVVKDIEDRFSAIEKENADLKVELSAIKEGDKFKSIPKKVEKPTNARKALLKK